MVFCALTCVKQAQNSAMNRAAAVDGCRVIIKIKEIFRERFIEVSADFYRFLLRTELKKRVGAVNGGKLPTQLSQWLRRYR